MCIRDSTLLHANYVPKSAAASSNYCSFKLQCKNNVLLSTAVVYVIDQTGKRHKAVSYTHLDVYKRQSPPLEQLLVTHWAIV